MNRVIYYNIITICSYTSRDWWLVFGGITVLTLITRFYKVTEPEHVW